MYSFTIFIEQRQVMSIIVRIRKAVVGPPLVHQATQELCFPPRRDLTTTNVNTLSFSTCVSKKRKQIPL